MNIGESRDKSDRRSRLGHGGALGRTGIGTVKTHMEVMEQPRKMPTRPGRRATTKRKKAGPGDPAAVPSGMPRPGPKQVDETGGPKGPEPTRYGDWERGGRCIDF